MTSAVPSSWLRELTALWRLAAPVVIVQLGLMAMGVVDAMMVGRVSAEALAAVALGNTWSFWLVGSAMGVLMALDPIIAQAAGAGDERGVARGLQRGLVIACLLSVPVLACQLATGPVMRAVGQPETVVPIASAYVIASLLGTPAFLLFVVLRQTLQALHRVRPIVVAVVVANLGNALLNWMLVFGRAGFPRLGPVGSGWATGATRWLMIAVLLAAAWPELRPRLLALDVRARAWRPLLSMIRLGIPIGAQHALEMGTFSAVALFMGWLGTRELAANQVALSIIATSFMVPLGISSAAAVRVGHAVGRGDPTGARRAAGIAVATGFVVMAASAGVLLVFPRVLARAFTPDLVVVELAVALLGVAAFFQLFDGLQVVAIGALRGAGDVRVPVVINIAGFLLLALPLGLWLAFPRGLGAVGLWWGLAAGLAVVALALLARLHRRLSGELLRVVIDEDPATHAAPERGGA